MTPRAAYDETSSRARYLLRLRGAVLNLRERKIRKDWKSELCRIMHWSKNVQIQRVDSADCLIILKDAAKASLHDFSTGALDDLLRSALVIGVSALDRYAHERVTKGIVKAFRKKRLLRGQEDFKIPASVALQLTERLRQARRTGKQARPANSVRKAIQATLHKRPFQSWRELEAAFELIGIGDMGQQIKAATGGSLKPLQDQLGRIARKRNQIVHEGDLVLHARGGRARRNPIEPSFVERSLDFLDDLVSKLEGVK